MASDTEDQVPFDLSAGHTWPWPDVPSDREAFLADLEIFHSQRETTLDKDPKVSNKQIDLWRLFQMVQERGGYDHVSAEKLAWRKLAENFGLHQPAYAFQVKTIFYKNLAAYAIKKVHHQDPPPKDILEDLTARGGDLLSRTRENFEPPTRGGAQDGQNEVGPEETQFTPKADKMDIDDPASTGRGGRSLRQAPAPRQIFVPDVSSSRQARSVGATPPNSQQTSGNMNGTTGVGGIRFDPTTYEGYAAPPQNLRAVATPSNQPLAFRNRFTKEREQHRSLQNGSQPALKGFLVPGTGCSGAIGRNIYARVLNCLKSPSLEDKKWAIHHLVSISESPGHRFRIDAFPGMAEGLLEVILKVSTLYYDVDWCISYEDQPPVDINVLDGLRSTPDILYRISRLRRKSIFDDLQAKSAADILALCNEAALVVRNATLLEPNAWFLASMLPAKDLICIVLHLPKRPELSELKHHALEIAAQIVKYLPLSANDPLYLGLLRFVEEGQDRGAILTALCAICRIAALAQDANVLPPISVELLNQLHSWLFLEDDELVQACLEYMYHYTAIASNVQTMLDGLIALNFPMNSFVEHLARLLKHNAKEDVLRREIAPAIPARKPVGRAAMPESLVQELLVLDEPTRASRWLKCTFEEDPKEDITQLELWQSYQNTFATKIEESGSAALMTAADFIKNVSTTLPGATAKIVKSPDGSSAPRFIMSGIRYKDRPTDSNGHEFVRCQWKENHSPQCESYHRPGTAMFDHVLSKHLALPDTKTLTSMSINEVAEVKTAATDCLWSSCRHFARCRPDHIPSAKELSRHVNLHMTTSKAHDRHEGQKHRPKSIAPNDPSRSYRLHDKATDSAQGYSAIYDYSAFYDTMLNEQGQPCGVAYWAVMVLRNLARSVPKVISAADEGSALVRKNNGKGEADINISPKVVWMQKLFLPIRRQVFHVLAYNRNLSGWTFDLLALMEKGMDETDGD